MKRPILIEEQLLDWTARRPSASVRAQLFGVKETPMEQGVWRWLVPGAACAMAALVLFGFVHNPYSTGTAAAFFQLSSSGRGISNGVQFAMNSIDFNLDRNVWAKATFEWTNHNVSPSSNGSLQLAKTNFLTR